MAFGTNKSEAGDERSRRIPFKTSQRPAPTGSLEKSVGGIVPLVPIDGGKTKDIDRVEINPYDIKGIDKPLKKIDLEGKIEKPIHFRFYKARTTAVILDLVPPEGFVYVLGNDVVRRIRVAKYELSTAFQQTGDLEYTCTPAAFRDLLNQVRKDRGNPDLKQS